MRSAISGWNYSSNDRYQFIQEGSASKLEFKAVSGRRRVGSVLLFEAIMAACFGAFWWLVWREPPVLAVGLMAMLLGAVIQWLEWRTDGKRRREGPLWAFDAAIGRFSIPRQKAEFGREQLLALQVLSVDVGEGKWLQINAVVAQPDGGLPRRHLIMVLDKDGWNHVKELALLRQFMSAANLPESLLLRQDEARQKDSIMLGYEWPPRPAFYP